MAKKIVICSDGTGNSFSKQVSNITHLIKSLELSDPNSQVVFYDQGLGTNPNLVEKVKEYKSEPGNNRDGLTILPPPKTVKSFVLRPFFQFAGLLFGYGLRENIKEMYKALAENYDSSDLVFLFGFSRGAFTVRALAGLIYRCGLPPKNVTESEEDFEKCFSEAYALYEPHHEDVSRINQFKGTYKVRDLEICLLGIWETVKSYGGMIPKSLPHLRHNPIVNTVCHALALNERRSWFRHTSWGWLDSDLKNLKTLNDKRYEQQEIKEVWFRGFHSDVGGGDAEEETAKIPLIWMLNEAKACGLILNDYGMGKLSERRPTAPPVHESLKGGWWITELFPRRELDNTTRPPGHPWKWGRTGARDVDKYRRNGKICLHPSVGNSYNLENVSCDIFKPKLIRSGA